MNSYKAQISILDGMTSFTGLFLILLLSLMVFLFLYDKILVVSTEKEILIRTQYAFEQLLSKGDPVNWHTLNINNTNNFGIEKENSVLDENKINVLSSALSLDPLFVKERLGIGKHNFSLDIVDFYNQSVLYSLNDTGSQNSTKTLSAQKLSTINHSLVLVRLRVFE